MENSTSYFKFCFFMTGLLFFNLTNAQSVANYDISVTTIWNSSMHSSVPGNAHWSDLIGATHSTSNEFVSLGMIATLGIKDVAERGDNDEIIDEIMDAITSGDADQLLQDGFPDGPEETAALPSTFVSEDFPFISLVAMVAPSPDWFIAINSLNLRSGNPAINNGWKDTFTMDVFAYDAGTDSGTDYGSANNPNTPVAVSMVNGFPIFGNKMATITFTYNSSTLSLDTVNALNNVKVFPNPSNGKVTIANILNSDLKTIEIYNVLGTLVKQVKIPTQLDREVLDLEGLSQGMYLMRLFNGSDGVKTQKLIMN